MKNNNTRFILGSIQQLFNSMFCRARTSVEWGFALDTQSWAVNTYKRKAKVFLGKFIFPEERFVSS